MVANLTYSGYKGYEAGGIGGAFKALTNAVITTGLSSAGSQIAFNGVFNASIGYNGAGEVLPATLSPLEDVAASAAGGAIGGAIGSAAGQLMITGDLTFGGLAEGTAMGAGLGIAMSDPVNNLLSGRGFKTGWQRAIAKAKSFTSEVGIPYGEDYFTTAQQNYECRACVADMEACARVSDDRLLNEGYWSYEKNHVDVRIHRSRGIDYHLGKPGPTGKIEVLPRRLLETGRFLNLSPEQISNMRAAGLPAWTGYGQPILKPWPSLPR